MTPDRPGPDPRRPDRPGSAPRRPDQPGLDAPVRDGAGRPAGRAVEHGRVVQEGTPGDIALHPRTDDIARLVGLNLYRGRADGHTVRLDAGPSITTTEELRGPVFVAFPPGAVTLYGKRPAGASARNLWHCEVAGLETHGDQIRADLTGELPLAADLTTVAAAELGLHPGTAGPGHREGDPDPRLPGRDHHARYGRRLRIRPDDHAR
ncbi:hypothetical protein SFUMM280S_07193 [Streptomyces fumanus]